MRTPNLTVAAAVVGALLVVGGAVGLAACDDGGETRDVLCDRQCPSGQKCAFVQDTLSTTCVSDGTAPPTGACEPACLSTQRCESGVCVARPLSCTEILDCVGDCPKPDACTAACAERGTAEAKARFEALDACAEAADCADSACLIAACQAQFDTCFGVTSCTPACASTQTCVNGVCQAADSGCGGVTAAGQCQGQTLAWCEGGTLKQQNCFNVGPNCLCGRRIVENYYDCICDGGSGICDPPCQPGSVCTAQGCAPGGGGGSSCVPACPPGFICTPQGCEISGF
ncbi:MAG: hypothetical protein R3F39_23660 [Myxococcota bacterium]